MGFVAPKLLGYFYYIWYMKQKNYLFLWFALGCIFLLSSCHNLVVGAGDIVEEISYPDNPVSKIELTGDFTVYLAEDTFYQVKVQGYENLVPHVTIAEESGKLTLGVEQDYILEGSNIIVWIKAPQYTQVKLSGSGSIESVDSITSPNLEVVNNGSGTISLFGKSNILNAYSGGSGLTRLCALQADTVNAFMLGSGYLSTKPMNKLNAQVQGSGQIQYIGSPVVSFSITGSGSLLQTLGCY
jgi:hypothetical protein